MPRRRAPNPRQVVRAAQFATALSDALYALGLTHKDLAEELGLARYTVDSWTRAENSTVPLDENLERLCIVLERRQTGLGARLADLAGAMWIRPPATPAPQVVAQPTAAVSLRAPATSFVGRERELAELRQLVNRARLVTLTGTGGIGKTRLALRASAELVGAFGDGVRVVELAALANPALVAGAVAATLGVPEQAGRPLLDALGAALHGRHMLLVLDNCEHVGGACAALVNELLSACPRLHVLATSREPLHVTGEVVWQVPALTLPDPRQPAPANQFMGYEATRLFVERAFFMQGGFVMTSQNSASVGQVCRRLDGIPLAIELAAACARDWPVEAIASKLDDRFHLLTRGNQTALPRQQTLQATIDWSYELLPAAQRTLFRRQSVFAGGWTLEAAEAICRDEGRPAHLGQTVQAALAQLVDKSLVVVEEHDQGLRFHMLETIREYARERLDETEDAEPRRAAHLAFYLDLAEEAQPQLRGARQKQWLNRLETEHENMRAALGQALHSRQAETSLRLASALGKFWEMRGYFSEGREWLARALALEVGKAGLLPLARAYYEAGRLALQQGDSPIARDHLARALEFFQHEEQAEGIGQALNSLGLVAMNDGDYTQARDLLEQGLAVHRQSGSRRDIAVALNNLGLTAKAQGDYEAARRYFLESIDIKRAMSDTRGMAMSLGNLGVAMRNQGDYMGARAYSAESLALFRQVGDKLGEAHEIGNMATAALWQGDLPAARELFEQTLALHQQLEDRMRVAFTMVGLGHVARGQGDYAKARAHYLDALERQRDLGNDEGVIEAMEGLSVLAATGKDFARAASWFASLQTARAARGLALTPFERAAREASQSGAEAELGADLFRMASEEGQLLSLEQAVAEALK